MNNFTRTCLLLCSFVLVLTNGINAQTAFQKTYGIGMMSLIQGAHQTADKGFIMTGFQNAGIPMRIELVKTDSMGVVQWAKEFGKELIPPPFQTEDPTAMAMPYCVRQTSDLGYIITGEINGDCYLVKTTSTGTVSWAKTYGGGDGSCGYYVKQTTDGGYIVTGYSMSLDGAKDSANVYLLKVTSTGNLTWDKVYRFSPNDDDYGNAVEEMSDGYIVVGSTGQVNTPDTTTDIVFMKTDLNGNVSWAYTFGDNGHSEASNHVKKTADGNVIFGGSTDNTSDGGDAFLFKTTTAGAVLWSHAYNIGLIDDVKRIDEHSDNYYLFGTTFSLLGITTFLDMFALNIATDGSWQSTNVYSQDLAHNFLWDAHVASDGGFVLGGWGQSLTGMSMDFMLIKTNPAGLTGCNEYTDNSGTKTYAPPPEAVTPTVFSTTSASNVATMTFTPTVTPSTLCELLPLVAHAGTPNSVCQGSSIAIGAAPTATGGIAPYTYSWSSNPVGFTSTAANPVVSPTVTTVYTVTVTDSNSSTSTSTVTITVLTPPDANAGNDASICEGQTTTLIATGGGTYSWGPTTGLGSPTTATTSASPTTPTSYTVTVTAGNGCTDTDVVFVDVKPAPDAYAGADAAICDGQSTTLTATGGGTYSWGPTTGLGSPTTATTSANPATPTTYIVTVTAANGCTDTDDVFVNVGTSPSAYAGADVQICPAEIIGLSATGGGTYAWSPSAGLSDTTIFNPDASPTITTTYIVLVTAPNACTDTDTITVTVNIPPVANAGTDANVCLNDSIQLHATGGGTYTWGPAATLNDPSNQNPWASPAIATTYYVTVTSGISCSATDSVIISVLPLPSVYNVSGGGQFCPEDTGVALTISNTEAGFIYHVLLDGTETDTFTGDGSSISNTVTQPGTYTIFAENNVTGCHVLMTGNAIVSLYATPAISSITVTDVSCFGSIDGALTIISPLATQYSINNGTTYQGSNTFTGLAPGVYHIIVLSTNGCSYDTTITLTPPSAISLDSTVTNAVCGANGSAAVITNGGTAPFSYDWSNDISNHTATASGLIDGIYLVTATDNHGCTSTIAISVQATAGTGTASATSIDSTSCNGNSDGSATVVMTNGIPPYNYAWSNDTANHTSTAINLPAGNYSVTISDNHNCSSIVNLTVGQPNVLNAAAGAADISCHGSVDGMAVSNATGGTAPYSYIWTGGIMNNTLTGLAAGNYSVTVTDAHGCTDIDNVTVLEPAEFVANATAINALCGGSNSGQVSVVASGGSAPYTYAWTGGYGTATVTGLPAGSYTVTVTDASLCQKLDIVNIGEPSAINSSGTSGINTATYEGFVNLTVTSGAPPYTYLWSSGATTEDITGLISGQYIVTVTDAMGCTTIDTFKIDIPLIIPDAITPNGDGINDNFRIVNIEVYDDVLVEIYTRWGARIFQFKGTGAEYGDVKNRWDGKIKGKDAPMGSYVYIIEIGGLDKFMGPVVVIY